MSTSLPTPPATPAPRPLLALAPTIRAPRTRVEPCALARLARSGEARVVLCFGGQAQRWWEDLEVLVQGSRLVRDLVARCTQALGDELAGDLGLLGLHPRGLDLLAWSQDPASRPEEAVLTGSAVSQPAILLTQAALLLSLRPLGFATEDAAAWAIAVVGHSQGIVPAVLAAEALAPDAFADRAARLCRYMAWQGARMQLAWGRWRNGHAPMVALSGPDPAWVEAELGAVPGATLALVNHSTQCVVSGAPEVLERAVRHLQRRLAERQAAFARGEAPPPPRLTSEDLPVGAPFHSPAMEPALDPLRADARRLGATLDPAPLALPVLRYEDGAAWRGDPDLVRSQCLGRVDWRATMAAVRALGATHVLDLGPGAGVAGLSARCLEGWGVRVVASATAAGQTLLRERDAGAVAPPRPWADRGPRARRAPDGRLALDNAFSRATGAPPLLLPGMTPTTAEAPLVAAAANAGFLAELAGGGQPTEACLRRRAEELRALLRPGEGWVLNALYLDRNLWDLQLGEQRLVQRLKAEGHPILGVTISAGLPPVEEAAALLCELRALGMGLNALKVGSPEQIEHALAIADRDPGALLMLQVEGGRAGGHHGLHELPDLLLGSYAAIRERPSVLLAAGGGLASPAEVQALLDGSWSLPHGRAPMPVDAVFLGTAVMAAAEARTSPAVKRALVATPGAARLLARGVTAGGVRSGRSTLGADIHYLDNHAARTAALLAEVAGDDAAARARRDEIAAALERTCKPWFGPLEGLSYLDLLERLRERLALGLDRPGDDGPWLDPSHRERFNRMLRRALRRCAWAGPWPETRDLDEPARLLATLAGLLPALAAAPLLPEDERFFVEEVCRGPGKPVPFVPVIDGEAHRWFCSDALWQAHDERWDADAVLVLPGPAGLAAIERADEPVAEILARFLAPAAAAAPLLPEGGAEPAEHVALGAARCLWGRRERENPLPTVIAAAAGRAELRPVGADGVALALEHRLPGGEPRHLTLPLELCRGHRLALRAGDEALARLRAFVEDLLAGEPAFPEGRADAWRRVVGDECADPLQLHFSRAFPAMMRALFSEVGVGDPLALLHTEGFIERLAGPGEGPIEVRAAGPAEAATPGGRLVQLGVELGQDGRVRARLLQRFLLRGAAGALVDGPAPEPLPEPAGLPLARPRLLLDEDLVAPVDMAAFAAAGGDGNPIHRDPALAALAGLPGPIVHGQWLAAAACARLASGRDLRWARVRFLDTVPLGARLRLRAEVVARLEGDEIVDLTLTHGERPVLALRARLPAPRTAVVFPGQGCQRRGMGLEAMARSPAARRVWERAEACCRARLGFSLIEAVRDNPRELDLAGGVLRHPEGVLNATQVTQVALAVLACAQVAELREAEALPEPRWLCGHSIGEYAALAALAGVIELEPMIELVFARGATMQRFVPRDPDGRSPYAMGVVLPHKAGLDGDAALALVKRIARDTGRPLFVVNHNVRDRQYAVAGHVDATDYLARALAERGEGAWVALPGLDVPFHSPLLHPGVPAFREVLLRCLAEDLPLERLEGRYVPNLVARPFRLDRVFVQAVIDATGTTELGAALADPRAHGRAVLVELLAWQFASPVRWIETQDLLRAEAERLLEIGPGEAPVLVGMLARSQEDGGPTLELLHGERDLEKVLGLGAAPEPAPAPTASPAVASTQAPAAVGPVPDAPLTLPDALRLVLALAVRRPLAEIAGTASLDALLGGNSARRNQVLAEIGRELGVPVPDAAHELPLPRLLEALGTAANGRYRFPGPWLSAQRDRALTELGLGPAEAEAWLETAWGLGPARRAAVLALLALTAREEPRPEGQAALERAVAAYANLVGVALARAAVQATAQDTRRAPEARGVRDGWARVARAALEAAGLDPALVDRSPQPEVRPRPAPRLAGLFDPRKHVALTGAATWARADALRWYEALAADRDDPELAERLARCASIELAGVLEALQERAAREGRPALRRALERLAGRVRRGGQPMPWAAETALITGAGPGSIAEALVARLLQGGARVVATTYPPAEPQRAAVARFRALYRRHAAAGAALHLVPFDQGSREDVDALCRWLVGSASEARGPRQVRTKEPWLPTLCFPFAAAPAEGDPTDLSEQIGRTLQINLVGVERLVGALARETGGAGRAAPRVHVVLPLSPNHGQLGRDGLYAESKAGLEALLHRWRSEQDRWGHRVTLLGARMGWVRGTGLMAGLDPVWRTVEAELGIQTFSPDDMAALLLRHCQGEVRRRAATEPVLADLTGGFGEAAGDLRAVIERVLGAQAGGSRAASDPAEAPLPRPLFAFPPLPAHRADAPCRLDPARAVAIVGFGEVGPFGNERGRWAVEHTGHLDREAALELAWQCGLVRFAGGRWEDCSTGEALDGADLAARFALHERVGVRHLDAAPAGAELAWTELRLEQDLVLPLPDETLARSIAAADPEGSEVFPDGQGGWTLRRRAGSRLRLPRQVPLTRRVAGQFPRGWDPARFGLDPDLLRQLDPVAAFNLVATAEAFRCAGADPAEIAEALHPSRVGSTQGGGIGGMRALRRLYVDPVLDRPRQTDALQEALVNVGPAWAACALHGGYGPMQHPVGACATAALSLELGADLILAGKADLIVAGAFDDLGPEGMRGFADMGATASDAYLAERGLDPDQASRPCDARRGGFVEAQGGGTLLLCRADRALALGLPIWGLIAGAWSRGDGLQGSIPAPGRGLLGLGAGGPRSPLARALAAFGLGPGDVGAVSIHGTSTEANDPNEVELHAALAAAIGRDPRQPLPVIAQKALTGHAKGGAAAWQAIGLLQAMTDGVIPPFRNLDEPDPALARCLPLCFPDEPLRVGAGGLRATLLTSLGFGHVGALVCFVHPDVLLEALPPARLAAYATLREERWRRRFREQHLVLLGERPAVALRAGQALAPVRERALLLDPAAGACP